MGQAEDGVVLVCRYCMVLKSVRSARTPSSLGDKVENGGEVILSGKDLLQHTITQSMKVVHMLRLKS